MEHWVWPALTTLGIVLLFFLTAANVGRQRTLYKIGPPHTSGHPMLERAYRVQMNTLEWGAIFLPLLWICALFLNPAWASIGGVVWIVSRAMYALSYMKNPETRLPGFMINLITVAVMFFASLWGVLRNIC